MPVPNGSGSNDQIGWPSNQLYRKLVGYKDKAWIQDDWDNGAPGMWSTSRHWPPSDADKSRLPRP
jgi:hypothetical protein